LGGKEEEKMKAHEFATHIEAFRAYNQSRGLSPKTIYNYSQVLHGFANWFVDEYGEEAEVTGRRIREYLAHKLASGNKARSVATYWCDLRALFSFLILDEVITESEDPMRLVKRPKYPRREIEPLTAEQVRKLLDTFDKASPAHYRDYIICLLILDTGLRIGEVAALALDDLDLPHSSIVVKNGKGGKKRVVYMGKKMGGILADYIENTRPLLRKGQWALFPGRYNGRRQTLRQCYLSRVIARRMHEAGIETNGSSAHKLRHTFAVNFIRNQGGAFPLQAILGHTTLEMTKKYVQLATEDIALAHAKASPLDNMEI